MSCTDARTSTAVSGYDLRRRTGINVHVKDFGHSQTHATLAQKVSDAGFGWVRLGIHTGLTAAQIASAVGEYQVRGVKFMLLPAGNLAAAQAVNPFMQTAMASLDPAMCIGLEGLNEVSNDATGASNSATQHASLAAIRAAVVGWSAVPIVSPSFSTAGITVNAAFTPLSPAVSMNNWHEYSRPGGISDADFEIGKARDKTGPFITNANSLFGEFGYPHADTADGTNIEIIDTAAGILLSRSVLYCLTFPGILYNALYELIDEPDLGGAEAHFGVLTTAAAAKSSYTQLSRLLNLIGETTTSTPTAFSWATSGGDSWDSRGVSTVVFQKANGYRYMCFWNAVNVVTDPSGGGATFVSGDLAIPAGVSATLTFDRSFTTINRYAPYLGAGIQATTSNASSWTGTAQAYVQVLELIP